MRGQKHVSLYLSIKDGKKRKMIYVPPHWEQTIRVWVEAHQQLKQMTNEVSQLCLHRFLAAKHSDRKQSAVPP
jgi:hypothetical protein